MEKTVIIKELISWAELSHEECVMLVRQIIADCGLDVRECFAPIAAEENKTAVSNDTLAEDLFGDAVSDKTDENKAAGKVIVFSEEDKPDGLEQPKRKRGRPKKVRVEETAAEKKAAQIKQTTEAPAKRKRGRPKKVKVEDGSERAKESVISAEDEALFEAAAKADVNKLLDDEAESVASCSMAKHRNSAFCYLADYPELKETAIGAKHPFEYLYKWKGRNLVSAYVLPDMMPVGIYVPYHSLMFGKYKGFVVSLYDEDVITNVGEAIAEAERAFDAIEDEVWNVMNSLQWGILRNVKSEISQMFKKVGGNILRNTYRTLSPHSNQVCGIGKFRYTVDVK